MVLAAIDRCPGRAMTSASREFPLRLDDLVGHALRIDLVFAAGNRLFQGLHALRVGDRRRGNRILEALQLARTVGQRDGVATRRRLAAGDFGSASVRATPPLLPPLTCGGFCPKPSILLIVVSPRAVRGLASGISAAGPGT